MYKKLDVRKYTHKITTAPLYAI